MDTGIWATWYDIDESERNSFVNWMHAEYLPFLKTRPGIAWVAHYRNEGGGHGMKQLGAALARSSLDDVAQGGQFLVLVGAPSPQVFFTPSVSRMKLPHGFAERLELQREKVTNVFMEHARVTGPALHELDDISTPAPAIQMGSFRIATPEAEFDLGEWYARERLPGMAAMPACIRTRRLVSVAGWAKHGILYEFNSLQGRLEQFETPHETRALDRNQWIGKVVSTTIHTPGSPVIGPRIWPPVAGTS